MKQQGANKPYIITTLSEVTFKDGNTILIEIWVKGKNESTSADQCEREVSLGMVMLEVKGDDTRPVFYAHQKEDSATDHLEKSTEYKSIYKGMNSVFMWWNGLGRLGWGFLSDWTLHTRFFPKGFYVFLCNIGFFTAYLTYYLIGFSVVSKVKLYTLTAIVGASFGGSFALVPIFLKSICPK